MRIQIADISKVYNSPTEPVDLATAKQHMRVDFTDDDTFITSLITQCRRAIENYCFVSIVPVTITVTLNYHAEINPYIRAYGTAIYAPYDNSLQKVLTELPYGPLPGGVTSVTSLGTDNSVNPLDPAAFEYYIRGVDFKSIEIVNTAYSNATIVYDAGYTTVPDDLVLALLNEIAFRMEARGDSTNRYAAQNVGVSEAAQYLANPYKRLAWL